MSKILKIAIASNRAQRAASKREVGRPSVLVIASFKASAAPYANIGVITIITSVNRVTPATKSGSRNDGGLPFASASRTSGNNQSRTAKIIAPVLSRAQRAQLLTHRDGLNPAELARQIQSIQDRLTGHAKGRTLDLQAALATSQPDATTGIRLHKTG